MMPIEVQVFLYVRNKLFCTKLLYFMPDARGCRAHARMPRARAAVCGTSVSFAVTIFKDILNHVYRGSILLDVRKRFCTKLLYTSCLMHADAASRRRCRAHARMPRAGADAARTRGCRARWCLWNKHFFCSYNLQSHP